ncbi:hypothetical protein R6Q57_004818 [Mikania cordata]
MADAPAVDDPPSSLLIPPLSPFIFSDDFTLPDDLLSFDYERFGITFDDEPHPSNTEDFFNSTFHQFNPFDLVSSDPELINPVPDPATVVTDPDNLSGNQRSDVPGFLNIPTLDNCDRNFMILDDSLLELRDENPVSSQGSENCDSAGLEPVMTGDIYPSPDSGNSVVDQKVEQKTTIKSTKMLNEMSTTTEESNEINKKIEKKKTRLIRNRESAHLSRQRKKQYVEELEDKVRSMQTTIHELNAGITYFAAENSTLKQQLVAGAGVGAYSPNVMYRPHPAMAPMGYPWMPFLPYAVNSQGSQVPLVPIPRLKTQKPTFSHKSKQDVKKPEGRLKTKTKKAASISFLGLLLFIVLFGGLVPIMNVRFGGVTDNGYSGKLNDYKFHNQQHHVRVLMSDDHVNKTNRNASEPLVASLYVPRNDKLMKIDGSLIIYSVLASEKAMAIREEQRMAKRKDTGLAVDLDLAPAIPNPTGKRYTTLSDHQKALPSNKENLQAKYGDGKLQQWFREGLSGLMLSSGMCTEVFQFDASVASASGAIVPATSVVNITAAENRHNSTSITAVKNRRILHGLPVPLSDTTTNITKEQVAGHDSKHEDHHEHNLVSSMVVSVLVDPREVVDGGDMDGGMMGGGKGKSFSRIFVVVLLDSVKYVTYSCMLPLKGTSHLVTA